jgi:uncharacterized protein YdeI (YjbR/CyaY-like superfamily)
MGVADKPVHVADSVEEWERFLEADPPDGGVRLRLRKKAARVPGITYAEALDVALCHGWIDGQVNSLDDSYFLQVFTPRRRASPWSKINRQHVERLTEAGRMRPSGQAEIDRAKADGRWDAAYRQSDQDVPEILQRALDANPRAAAAFAAASSRDRFAMTFRIQSVKRIETKERKVAEYIAMLERGDTIHP